MFKKDSIFKTTQFIFISSICCFLSCHRENVYTSKQLQKEIKKYHKNFQEPPVPFFSFRLPERWTVDFYTINDETGHKVGQIDATIHKMCFESDDSLSVRNRKNSSIQNFPSKEFTLGNRKVELRNVGGTIDGAVDGARSYWYVYHYCINDNDKAFEMYFYDYKQNSEKQKIYEEILKSAQF